MNRFLAGITLVIAALLQYSVIVYAGPLDDYYLQQFGETKSIQLQKALLTESPDALESAQCGMPLKHGLRRDWNLLEQSTQKVLAKQLALPTLTLSGEATTPSTGGHFIIHYATISSPKVCQNSLSSNNGKTFDDVPTPQPPYTLQSWVQTVGDTFEFAYGYYIGQGYNLPPNFPATPYNVYLRSLACDSMYGVTQTDQPVSSASHPNAFTSWIELENNFTNSIYNPATYSPLQSLQITAAHEYHHAIQYGYNFNFDVWYAEATSTWMEDEVYDSINQNYTYIPAWFTQSKLALDIPASVTTGGGYGRWIFNRYLSEKHGPAMIRSVWEKVGGLPSPGNNTDIPMVPILDSLLSSATYGTSLGSDFFGFAKRVYDRNWAANPHNSETDKIHLYSPVASYSAYPVNSAVTSPAPPSITLPHYSFAYYKFTPTAGVTSLKISISKSSGIQTALFKKVGGVISEIAADAIGTTYVESAFAATGEVVLLIANTSSLDGHTANFSTDGSNIAVAEPPPPTTPASSTSKSSGCFIATAAYGSYLHPQVQLLRHFRDDYLLTNAPGRAFVALYYRFSPPLADFIARHTVLRSMTRLALTPFIVAVVHPLISFVSLFLLIGTLLASKLRRIKAARSNARRHIIRTT